MHAAQYRNLTQQHVTYSILNCGEQRKCRQDRLDDDAAIAGSEVNTAHMDDPGCPDCTDESSRGVGSRTDGHRSEVGGGERAHTHMYHS